MKRRKKTLMYKSSHSTKNIEGDLAPPCSTPLSGEMPLLCTALSLQPLAACCVHLVQGAEGKSTCCVLMMCICASTSVHVACF